MRTMRPCDLRISPFFRALCPPLAADEFARLEASLRAKGCRDPLVVWKGQNLLLDGHNRLQIIKAHRLPFRVEEVDLPTKEACCDWIVENQIARRNLTPETASCLRGARYNAAKGPRGGDHTSARAKGQAGTLLDAAEQVAKQFNVSPSTIKRDGRLAAQIDTILANCAGLDARQVLLARDSGLTRGGVARIAKLTPPQQRQTIEELLATKKLPRKPRTVRTPRERVAVLARSVFEKDRELARHLLVETARLLDVRLPEELLTRA